MKSDDKFNNEEFVSRALNSAFSNQYWQMEYMQTRECLWKKMDEAACKLMEAMIPHPFHFQAKRLFALKKDFLPLNS